MHCEELGHNFGSAHTHNTEGQYAYDPRIDTCGVSNSCPADLPQENAATIMSYCNNW